MVTITASRVWTLSTLRKLLWMVPVLLVGTWLSQSCIVDSAMSNMAEYLCLCRVRWSQRGFEDHSEGFPKRSSSPLKRSATGGVAIGAGWDLCRTGYTTCFLWCSPWWSVYGRVPNCVGLSIAGSTPCLEPPQRAPSGQGQSGPYGQYCNRCVYQPARRFTLPSYVATRPPPPHQESEASEVPSCHPHPWSVQSGNRRASTSMGVKISSPGGSADLGMVRSWSGGPVCISRYHPLQVVLLTNRGNARHGCTGTQLAPGPAQICIYPSEPNGTDNVQDQGGWGAGLVSGSILAQQDLVPGTHDSPFLADSFEEGFAFFPARLCIQGSYHSLQGPGSELASAAPGGGRPSHCFTLSFMCTVTVHG